MIELINGDCLEEMKKIPDGSIDLVLTDPPYGLEFMGKDWDKGVPGVHFWVEMLRVLKPGGYLLSFGGTRTYHRMASAIEDGGFEVRDMIEWVYGSGFPKSLNISKAIEATEKYGKSGTRTLRQVEQEGCGVGYELKGKNNGILGETRIYQRKEYTPTGTAKEWEGWGTALKPAHEPICMARKPLAEKTVAENCLKWGVGGINIDESRVGTEIIKSPQSNGVFAHSGSGAEQEHFVKKNADIVVEAIGRFPANLIHDNSEEVRECFPDSKSPAKRQTNSWFPSGEANGVDGEAEGYGDSGNAARFYKSIIYQAKASKSERNKGCDGLEEKQTMGGGGMNNTEDDVCGKYGSIKAPAKNHHPTVKPVALMEYLTNMCSKEGAVVLDPFMGSGTTGVACKNLNRDFIGIELDKEYFEIAKKRINEI